MFFVNPSFKYTTLCVIALCLFFTSVRAQQQWRVVAKVKGLDSVVYIYDKQSNRGSTYNSDYIGYDSAIGYSFDAQYLPSKIKEFTTRNYTGNGDSVYTESYYFDYNKVADIDLMRTDTFTYNAKGQVTKHISYRRNPYVVIPDKKYQYTYDAQGNLLEFYFETYDKSTSAFKPSTKNIYTYDASNKLLSDSTSYYNTSATWVPRNTLSYSYNAQGNVTEIEDVYYNGGVGAPKHNGLHYYYYNAQGLLEGDSVQTVVLNNDPQIHTYYYNANGMLTRDSFYLRRLNQPGPYNAYITVEEYNYTSFDYIDEIILYRADQFGNILPDSKTKYYYESYFPVSIGNTKISNQNLTIYPVPTGDMLNIRWDAKQTTQVQGRIVNNIGQTVWQWIDNVEGMYIKQVLTNSLPNGIYYIVLQADGMEVKKKFMITR